MVTNAYPPLVGGVARSAERFAAEYRRRGHRVLVVAPRGPDDDDARHGAEPDAELDTVRVPAIRSLDGGDFAISVPLSPAHLREIADFRPDIVHSHHPYQLGAAAVRLAAKHDVPLVFTYHTLYEHHAHHAAGGLPALKRFAADLAHGYCNLVDVVIAPSQSVAAILQTRGVVTPVEVIPTGVDLARFGKGTREAGRRAFGIPPQAFLAGFVGRLAPQKNLDFLGACVGEFLRTHSAAHFLVVGDGPERSRMKQQFAARGVAERVHFTGPLSGAELVDAYAALDVLAFASRTETEGLVLVEAMAAGVPAVALDGPGVREVIRDGMNGRLLAQESKTAFVAALAQFAEMDGRERARWREDARRTAERFAIETCAAQSLDVYATLMAENRRPKETERSAWEAARRRIEAEWRLWSTRVHAAGAAFDIQHPARFPVLRQAFRWWRRFRRWFSRREWSVKLLDLPVSEGTADEPGLILLQIDGLSRHELERALARGRLPFLKQLLEREFYSLRTMYSGQPATTPAVLGELFYGVPQAVPAFGFRDHRSGKLVQMFYPETAATVQQELARQGEGLLAEGAAYCDIYSGGARESSFCPATIGWRNLEDAALWRQVGLFLLNVMSLVRIAALSIVELAVAIVDCVRGIATTGIEVWQELAYVPRRVIVNTMLREFMAISAEVDATRGLRAIHANFLGYDENAHRRGPDALFAHYALRGIDRAIRRIWNAAHASRRRNYHVWIMSDHGQEHTVPYPQEYGEEIGAAVERVYRAWAGRSAECGVRSAESPDDALRTPHSELRTPEGPNPGRERPPRTHAASSAIVRAIESMLSPAHDGPSPTTIAIGPLGHIYWPDPLADSDIDPLARQLVDEARVPLVLAKIDGTAWAWTPAGKHRMPDEARAVLAPGHPHLEDAARDLAQLCDHPDAGEFVICGWRNDAMSLTFLPEHGSHAGPGPKETSGFVLLPGDAPLPEAGSGTFRPLTLRKMALSVLHQGALGRYERYPEHAERMLRVATYNVHSCIGLDGRLSPARIARVLATAAADVIALQELDVGRGRSGFIHQAEQITRALEMEFHFHPSFRIEEEQFGTAVLSRLPVKLVRTGILPSRTAWQEPRGVLWVEVDVDGVSVQIVTTHLGLSASERELQIDELLGPNWLCRDECGEAVVLCGDFNMLPRSRGYRRIASRYRDVQRAVDRHSPLRTWFGPFPLTRIDHVFVGEQLRVKRVEVPRTRLSRIASDHLPLVVDLEVLPVGRQ
ncbi:MAG: glycosyltransferase [Planctomycetales bacterium]